MNQPEKIGSAKEWLARTISQTEEKAVPFVQYMEWCLYHPQFGYYMNGRPKVGRDGDFYTSSSITPLMGEMVARYLSRWAVANFQGRFTVVEWGGGTGRMAKPILDEFRSSSVELYDRMNYLVIEKSSYHTNAQRNLLESHAPKVSFWTEQQFWEHGPRKQTLFFSNELLDAFPVHRIRREGERLLEQWVIWEESKGQFEGQWRECCNPEIYRYLRQDNIQLAEGQEAEVNLQAESWIKKSAGWLEEGGILTIDYGDQAAELYSPHRMKGTLLCYRRHVAEDLPFQYPAQQDMTSHVNFSACIRAGREGGVSGEKWMTQKQFLVEQGILECLQDHQTADPFSPEAKKNRAIRQLLWSDGMSELFKVLIQTKGASRLVDNEKR